MSDPIDAGRRAAAALETVRPILDSMEAAYLELLQDTVARAPENDKRIRALAEAAQTYSRVRKQLESLVANGLQAEEAKRVADRLEGLHPVRKKYLGIPV